MTSSLALTVGTTVTVVTPDADIPGVVQSLTLGLPTDAQGRVIPVAGTPDGSGVMVRLTASWQGRRMIHAYTDAMVVRHALTGAYRHDAQDDASLWSARCGCGHVTAGHATAADAKAAVTAHVDGE